VTPHVALLAYRSCGEHAKAWLRRLHVVGFLHGHELEEAIGPCPPDHADKLLDVFAAARFCERASLHMPPSVAAFMALGPVPAKHMSEVIGVYGTNWWYRVGAIKPEWA
jgi:hypothetical protein